MKQLLKTFVAIALLLVASIANGEEPPGVVINKSPEPKTIYAGSPSLVILPNGDYLVSHNWFGPGTSTNETVVFSSTDKGLTWKKVSEVQGQFWSTLFVLEEKVYLLGTNKANGSVVIRQSDDAGKTWSEPTSGSTGLLFSGAFYTAPVPAIRHDNRVWRTIEKLEKQRSQMMVMSASVDSDLLDAKSWSLTNQVSVHPNYLGGVRDRLLCGNIVAHPKSGLAILTRVDNPRADRAAVLTMSEDGKRIDFDPKTAFVDFPGGRAKFVVRYDQQSDKFWAVSNQQHEPFTARNKLVLASSPNLRDWTTNTILLHHVDSVWHGSHQTDWQFDGDDIVAACQSAANGANSSSNSNYITFHRFKGFRTLMGEYATPVFGRTTKTSFSHPDFDVIGTQFRIKELESDCRAFGSFSVQFKDVPKVFNGWKFTQTVGGSRIEMKVRIKRDCRILFMTAATSGGVIDVSGWAPVDVEPFHYSDSSKTPMAVFSQSVKRGDVIAIPQGNWSGGILLIPPP